MNSPVRALEAALRRLGVPLLSLQGGPTELHIVFDPARVTPTDRKVAFTLLAKFDWTWGQDAKRGD